MAEIKSTLDLIMERTRNLSLTAEEKEALRHDEQVSRVKGWVQRYEDKTIRTAEIKKELNAELQHLLRREILERLQPDASNEPLYQMLEELLGIERTPFEQIAGRFRRTIDAERERRRAGSLADLAARGISGSALIPNIPEDREWQRFHERVRNEFREEIGGLP